LFFAKEVSMSLVGSQIAEVARLVGEPARANILSALMDQRALTASELAFAAHVTPQTASSHLAKLAFANLVRVERQGRHRYYRLASEEVAQMLEGVMNIGALAPPRFRPRSKLDEDLRAARSCYDHLAGRLGVALADALAADKLIIFEAEACEVTAAGLRHLEDVGIVIEISEPSRRAFCRTCLDWSERRFHLAGRVGAAILQHCLDRRWLERQRSGRALKVTERGRSALIRDFHLDPAVFHPATDGPAAPRK
jgi:DNA-binding transcriptional ArsR family regulator